MQEVDFGGAQACITARLALAGVLGQPTAPKHDAVGRDDVNLITETGLDTCKTEFRGRIKVESASLQFGENRMSSSVW